MALWLMSGLAILAAELRPGVFGGRVVDELPLPLRGYTVYFIGELHGIAENEEFQLAYLKRLRAAGLRDVAIEEDGVYEEAAQAFVSGRSGALPQQLCLRAGILQGIRDLNSTLGDGERVRVHLTDIDSPAVAIRQHLMAIQQKLQADRVKVPTEGKIQKAGLQAVARLRRLTRDGAVLAELRTIALSIQALRDGLEVDVGPPKGSPYLDSREEAIAGNILALLRTQDVRSLLVLYGADHVSRRARRDGGPDRDQPFRPAALRLQEAGVKAYSVVTFPLQGRSLWRGQADEFPWTAADGRLALGEGLERVVAAAVEARYFWVDRERERVRLPSQDVSSMAVDGFVLFPSARPMRNYCDGGGKRKE